MHEQLQPWVPELHNLLNAVDSLNEFNELLIDMFLYSRAFMTLVGCIIMHNFPHIYRVYAIFSLQD